MQVVAADITAIAYLLEVGYNATLATPPLNTKQAVTVFNSFVTVSTHALPSRPFPPPHKKKDENERITNPKSSFPVIG